MEQDKWYHILGHYLREHLPSGAVFLGFVAIFVALETEAVLYAAGLCLLFGAAVMTVHFIFYLKKHRERMRILQNIRLLVDELPEPETLAEEDLQEMVRELKRLNEVTETARAQGKPGLLHDLGPPNQDTHIHYENGTGERRYR